MNIRTFGSRVLTLSALALGSLAVSACGEQPEVQCFAALSVYSPFTVSYTLESGTGECAQLKADSVGLQTYVTNPTKKTDGINSIAIQSLQMGNWVLNGRNYRVPADEDMDGMPDDADMDGNPDAWTPDPKEDDAHEPYALGKFTSKHPNSNDICEVPTLSPAELVLPALNEYTTGWDDELPTLITDDETTDPDGAPEVVPAQPAVDAKLEWSNVQVFVTPGDTGTQFGADLTYTLNGCTAKYKAVGVNVSFECESDADCTVDNLKANHASASYTFGDLKCVESSEPNPADLSTFKKLCVLQGKFPVLD